MLGSAEVWLMLWIAVTIIGCMAFVWADRIGPWAEAITKMAASTGFIGVAICAGALEGSYGRLILVALAFSWVGDACLLSRSDRGLGAGIVFFMLAHLGYLNAFRMLGLHVGATVFAALALAVVGLLVARWLWPHVPSRLRGAVGVYIVVITSMLSVALGSVWENAPYLVGLGALAFYLSDLFVAFDRFVGERFRNRLIGLPLYYGAQLLLALSVAAV